MKVKFWGVRGSIPCPGPNTVKYGGNTACIELRFPDRDRLAIIDAGSGIRELGNRLLAGDAPQNPIQAELFLTHTHWDHVMGFPFFAPIYLPTTRLKIHGPVTHEDESLEALIGRQFSYRFFPVRQAELASHIEYVDLKEGAFDLGDGILLRTKYLNHPVLSLGYRFECDGKAVCTVYDTEPFQNLFLVEPTDPAYDESMALEGEQVAAEENERLEAFLAGADLLVYDAQYSQAEYDTSRKGWGHSSIEWAIASARRSRVKHLALFHHDPARTDAQLDQLQKSCCTPPTTGPVNAFFAREGMEIIL